MNFDTILTLIENDELEKAIEALKESHRSTSKFKDIVLVAAWYNEFRSNANSGSLSYEQQVMEKNRIRRSLIELLPDEKPAVQTSITSPSTSSTGAGTFPGDKFFKEHVKQVKLRLFEGGIPCPTIGERTYTSLFPQSAVRYIWWEIEVVCLPSDAEVKFDLTFFYYNSKGDIMGSKGYNYAMTFPANQTVWLYWWGWGYADPGKWTPDNYRIEIYAEKHLLASGNFTIQ